MGLVRIYPRVSASSAVLFFSYCFSAQHQTAVTLQFLQNVPRRKAPDFRNPPTWRPDGNCSDSPNGLRFLGGTSSMTDRKKPGWAFWATVGVAGLVLYDQAHGGWHS